MKTRVLLALAAVLILAACSTVSMTGRKQLNIVSESEILSASLTEYQSYMKTAKISSDKNTTAVVKNVAQRIAQAAEAYLRTAGQEADIANYSWEFNLVDDSQLNAFCMPGGKIVVYTGMMKLIGNGTQRLAQQSVVKMIKEDPDLAKEYLEQVNGRLAERGIKQITLSPKMRARLGIEEHSESFDGK